MRMTGVCRNIYVRQRPGRNKFIQYPRLSISHLCFSAELCLLILIVAFGFFWNALIFKLAFVSSTLFLVQNELFVVHDSIMDIFDKKSLMLETLSKDIAKIENMLVFYNTPKRTFF